MNINWATFLSRSLKYLNIANKALPLIKELNPTYNKLKNKFTYNNVNQLQYTNKPHKNNNLTFFK